MLSTKIPENRASIMRHLHGVNFPVEKNNLIEAIKRDHPFGAEDVKKFIEKISERKYFSPEDVIRELHQVNKKF